MVFLNEAIRDFSISGFALEVGNPTTNHGLVAPVALH